MPATLESLESHCSRHGWQVSHLWLTIIRATQWWWFSAGLGPTSLLPVPQRFSSSGMATRCQTTDRDQPRGLPCRLPSHDFMVPAFPKPKIGRPTRLASVLALHPEARANNTGGVELPNSPCPSWKAPAALAGSTSAIALVWRTWFDSCRWWNLSTCRVNRTTRRRASSASASPRRRHSSPERTESRATTRSFRTFWTS